MLVDTSKYNAVTSTPSWPVDDSIDEMSLVSFDPPNDLVRYGASNFSVWQSTGEEFMIKSSVNNWLACVSNTGSLVRYEEGSVTCRLIRSITSICPDLPTTEFWFYRYVCGAELNIKDEWRTKFYYLDGCLNKRWPAHDPCGQRQRNHLKDLWPQGQIWVR